MSENNESRKRKRARASTKARNALDAHRRAEQQRRDAESKRREGLEAAAKVEKSLELAAQREQLRKQEAEVRTRLGRAVIDNILRSGLQGALLTAEELQSWSSDQQEQLNTVITARSGVTTTAAPSGKTAADIIGLDIDLNV